MYKVLTSLLFIMALNAQSQQVFCRFLQDDKPAYAELKGGKLHPLDKAPWDGGKWVSGRTFDTGKVKLLAPCDPKLILGLGKSYSENWQGRQVPKTVRWFLKPPASANGPGEAVYIPPVVDALKVEVELVIVLGKSLKNATEEEAADAIFGYTVGNDIVGFTESYYQKEGAKPEEEDPLLGSGLKIGDGFAPFGPFIHTGIDWRNRKRSLVIKDAGGNVKTRYENNTSGLLYSPEKILSDLSRVLTLSAGDVVFTGTTKSFVTVAGDVVEIAIEGIGEMKNPISLIAK